MNAITLDQLKDARGKVDPEKLDAFVKWERLDVERGRGYIDEFGEYIRGRVEFPEPIDMTADEIDLAISACIELEALKLI